MVARASGLNGPRCQEAQQTLPVTGQQNAGKKTCIELMRVIMAHTFIPNQHCTFITPAIPLPRVSHNEASGRRIAHSGSILANACP